MHILAGVIPSQQWVIELVESRVYILEKHN